jgi:hypothetical protein
VKDREIREQLMKQGLIKPSLAQRGTPNKTQLRKIRQKQPQQEKK